MKNSLRKAGPMRAITRSRKKGVSHTQKSLWFSNYKSDDSSDDLGEE
jgi:hypothetical protein